MIVMLSCKSSSDMKIIPASNPWPDNYVFLSGMENYKKWGTYNVHDPASKKFGDTYYLFYIAGRRWITVNGKPEPVYKIRMATSKDTLNWEKYNKDLIEDLLNENEAQASPDVIFANGKYHMFFCYREASDFRKNKDRSYKIGYAYSSDLFSWIRDDSKVGIEISEKGWDSEMIAYPHVVKLNGKYYMFYLGNEVGKYGFGIAELEGDLL
jgi:predicted GH43/DUF377 family glycosyl hydrolase